MKTNPFIVAAGLIFVGCSGSQPNKDDFSYGSPADIPTITVTQPKMFETDSLFAEIGFIRLDTTRQAYMSTPTNLRVYKDRIYLVDIGGPGAVLMFDISGKFIRKIGRIGRGPQELITISRLEIDYVNDRLYLADNSGYQCVVFDLDGNYLFTVPLGDPAGYIGITEKGNIVHESQMSAFGFDLKTMTQRENIKILDTLGNLIATGFDYNYNRRINAMMHTLSESKENRVTFAPMFRDTIYHVTEERIDPLYAFDFSKVKELTKKRSDDYSNSDEMIRDMAAGYMALEGKHIDTPDVLYAQLGFGIEKMHLFYDKKSGKTVVRPFRGNETELFPYDVDDYWNGYFYGSLESFQVMMMSQTDKPLSEQAKRYLDGLDPDDYYSDAILYFKLKQTPNNY
ncbi:MAG: 6-bladed beta-propeller [Rikenellaceae bacterium]|jgi:hypothetical protein|nr:6-bladed beta-propeller [Rikenellaceae bacterium]